jgi:hypothetical protein
MDEDGLKNLLLGLGSSRTGISRLFKRPVWDGSNTLDGDQLKLD